MPQFQFEKTSSPLTCHGLLRTTGSKSTLTSTGSSSQQSPTVEDDSAIVQEFQLNYRLGEGAYGTVYAATHVRTNKRFAVKVMQRSNLLGNERQILSEAVIMQSLRHKHVVQFLKLLRTPFEYYFVMDLAEGGELFDQVIQSRRFEESVARKYFQQLLSAIAYCHSQGVAHRDLKAENLLLDKQGDLLVCDFGFSWKSVPVPVDDEDESLDDDYCQLPTGTLHYVSPEALDPRRHGDKQRTNDIDPFAQDLWAAGVILYFMLSGELPFDGRDEEETIFKITHCSPSWETIPVAAAAYLKNILVRDAMDRFTLSQMITDPWFSIDVDTSLFPGVFEDSLTALDQALEPQQQLPAVEVSEHTLHTASSFRTRSEECLPRRHSSRLFLDFSHSPAESVSPTAEEEEYIRRAFCAIDTDGYGDHFTADELRDALIVLKKSTVDSAEVNEVIHLFTSSDNAVTYKEFRDAWIIKDLAHCNHRDKQYMQLFQLANLTHTDCEKHIVRELRDAFNSVDVMRTGVISFSQWKALFHSASLPVSDEELHGLLQYWRTTLPADSDAITFEDFVAGIVKRDILLKHPMGKKLAYATNLAGYAELRSFDQSVSTGFLVLGMREVIADKIALNDRLILLRREDRTQPAEIILSEKFAREGQTQPNCSGTRRSPQVGSQDGLRRKNSGSGFQSSSLSGGVQSAATSPSKGLLGQCNGSCSTCCVTDVILCPTACIGYTMVKLRRISGSTADFHEFVKYILLLLDRERDQANLDCCVRGDSELM